MSAAPPPAPDPLRLESEVRALTVVASPPLVPELRLHMVTSECPLWRAREPELERLGLGEPYWAFCWTGGQALARFLLDRPRWVRGRRVLALGVGGGIEAIAAARAGAASVRATDLDPRAVAATRLNARLAGVELQVDDADLLGVIELDVDVVLAADVTYSPELAAAVRDWLRALAARGVTGLIADPGRGFLAAEGLRRLTTIEAPGDNDRGGDDLRPTPILAALPRAAGQEAMD